MYFYIFSHNDIFIYYNSLYIGGFMRHLNTYIFVF